MPFLALLQESDQNIMQNRYSSFWQKYAQHLWLLVRRWQWTQIVTLPIWAALAPSCSSHSNWCYKVEGGGPAYKQKALSGSRHFRIPGNTWICGRINTKTTTSQKFSIGRILLSVMIRRICGKGSDCNNDGNETVQFKHQEVSLFKKNICKQLQQLPMDASDRDILSVDGTTLHLSNKKNEWNGTTLHLSNYKNEWKSLSFTISIRSWIAQSYPSLWTYLYFNKMFLIESYHFPIDFLSQWKNALWNGSRCACWN